MRKMGTMKVCFEAVLDLLGANVRFCSLVIMPVDYRRAGYISDDVSQPATAPIYFDGLTDRTAPA